MHHLKIRNEITALLPYLYSLLFRICGEEARAEDLVQETTFLILGDMAGGVEIPKRECVIALQNSPESRVFTVKKGREILLS